MKLSGLQLMRKRFLLLIQFALLMTLAVSSDALAQAVKPSQVVRQVSEHRQKLYETLWRDGDKPRSPSLEAPSTSQKNPVNWSDHEDEVRENIIKFVTERASGFKIEDWKGEELMALGELYQMAEQYAPAAEAFRAFLKSDSRSEANVKSWSIPNARARLIYALIETEQFDEAERWMEGSEWLVSENPPTMAARTGLYRSLAVALHDHGYHERAASLADKGYKLANALVLSGNLNQPMLESTERNQVVMAALAVACYERVGRKREASDLNELAQNFDFSRRPEFGAVYESELAAARLIGTQSPELDVLRWIDGKNRAPKTLNDLRGNVVLLNFWAMWSDPFTNTAPRLRELQSKYQGRGLEIIGVTKLYGRSDTEEFRSRDQEFKGLQDYVIKHQLTYSIAIGKMDDVTNDERFGVVSIPTTILIDRRGVVRQINRGPGEYRKLQKQIEKLLGEK